MAHRILLASLLATLTATTPLIDKRGASHNNFSCKSTVHPNPVVLFHGLGATYYEDLNVLQSYLQSINFCTFSITYGDYPGFP